MYSINLQKMSDKTMATLDVTGDMLSIWHARLSHADQDAIDKVVKIEAVHGIEIAEGQSTNNCSPRVEETMTNTQRTPAPLLRRSPVFYCTPMLQP